MGLVICRPTVNLNTHNSQKGYNYQVLLFSGGLLSKPNAGATLIIVFLIPAIMLLQSCNKKVDTIKNLEIESLPALTVYNDTTTFIDSGRVQLVMSFPLMESYSNNNDPYSDFRMGIRVVFYDGESEPAGYVTAKYARYNDKKKLWELRDSVVIINGINDRLETEQLFWDQEKDLIHSDRFVKIINEDQTIMGTGFESDIRLNKRRIKNPSGPLYLKDE